jgi:macrolide-specific efflux system membrane fusion protein
MLVPKLLLLTLLAISQSTVVAASQPVHAASVLIRLIDDVEVPARVAGALASIDVVEGQFVEKGFRLAQIDDMEARVIQERARVELEISAKTAENDVAIRSATKTLTFGRSDYGRLKRAVESFPRSVSQTELEETELRAEQAELDLEHARHEFDLATLTKELKAQEFRLTQHQVDVRQILAPLSGIVVDVARRSGEWVEAGDKVLRIVRMDRLRAEGFVQAADAARITHRAPAQIIVALPEQGTRELSGEIVFVSPEVNPVNGQVRVWAEFDNHKSLIRPGLRGTMTIRPEGGTP